MALIVQKYGGTSVGSVERIQAVAARVSAAVKAGHELVVVVSAMGKTTDALVALAKDITDNPSRREMDMLLSTGEQVSISLLTMALHELGCDAISMTGAQMGIVTEAAHSRARILHVESDRIRRQLDAGKVVVAAGFQGVANRADLEITTLGRGGSDTSAVALAAALQASCCEIYTDVPGILTTDPRLVPEARIMESVSADEMLELASLGAKVLHPRAVEIARNYGVDLVVRSSWTDEPGTRVVSPPCAGRSLENLEIARPVDAITYDTSQAQVSLLRIPDRPGIVAKLFGELARQTVDVDLIVQSIHEGDSNDIAFTVQERDLNRAEATTAAIAPTLRDGPLRPMETEGDTAELLSDRHVAAVSIHGAGMIGRPGVAAQMFESLAAAGINIEIISTSEVQVGCIIAPGEAPDPDGPEPDLDALCQRAVAALRKTFDLPEEADAGVAIAPQPDANLAPVSGVALDASQSQIAIRHVPDRPGMAAQIFQLLASEGISVDMIIQSQRRRVVAGQTCRDIAFSVAEADLGRACDLLEASRTAIGWERLDVTEKIAKVSAVGKGMVGCPGVAAKMFAALADRDINIQTIVTSQIKISCAVDRDRGVEALQAIHDAFGLSGRYQAANREGLTPA
ncbi:MAG: aspartate kinase [Cyanophyceae cyanobacterium]